MLTAKESLVARRSICLGVREAIGVSWVGSGAESALDFSGFDRYWCGFWAVFFIMSLRILHSTSIMKLFGHGSALMSFFGEI
jgi:hypothetical protein